MDTADNAVVVKLPRIVILKVVVKTLTDKGWNVSKTRTH